jgi:hypothetical protein
MKPASPANRISDYLSNISFGYHTAREAMNFSWEMMKDKRLLTESRLERYLDCMEPMSTLTEKPGAIIGANLYGMFNIDKCLAFNYIFTIMEKHYFEDC